MQNRVNQIKAASLLDRSKGFALVDRWLTSDGSTTRLLTKQLSTVQLSLNNPSALPWATDPDVLKIMREMQQRTGVDGCGVRRARDPVVRAQVPTRLPRNVFILEPRLHNPSV